MKKQNEYQHSQADVEAETLSLESLLASVEQTENLANAALNPTHEEIQKANDRRDYIVYLTIKGVNVTSMEIIANIARKFDCDPNQIIEDIHSLTDKDIWKKHKKRLKDRVNGQINRRSALTVARKNDISNKMLQSFSFNAETLLNLSSQFECRPVHIVDDIRHFKKFSTQKQFFIDQRSKAPMIRALTRFARFNIQY
ncbi:hypothetical protein [Shewanella glacialimarina]|jgi:hypothetical protein|uniref:hypothetical protein n=1 Tax=Shewanella glacialimarina TaxID=2590884 RepID=UPI001CF7FBFA|nr:hypothetical protein [Shewanella glacialimarina]UCX05838.1 hypothetical protein FJ709_15925 [Shewanella glacialimarina]